MVKPRQGLGSVSNQLLKLTGLTVHLRSPLWIGAEKSIQATKPGFLTNRWSNRPEPGGSAIPMVGVGGRGAEEVEGCESRERKSRRRASVQSFILMCSSIYRIFSKTDNDHRGFRSCPVWNVGFFSPFLRFFCELNWFLWNSCMILVKFLRSKHAFISDRTRPQSDR